MELWLLKIYWRSIPAHKGTADTSNPVKDVPTNIMRPAHHASVLRTLDRSLENERYVAEGLTSLVELDASGHPVLIQRSQFTPHSTTPPVR